MRKSGNGPLFCSKNGVPISASVFSSCIAKIVKLLQISGKLTAHSFKIGAASYAAANGVSNDEIKRMGRWVSDAFLKYIRLPELQLKFE